MSAPTGHVTENRTMGRVIALAWSDAAFKAQLLAQPKVALAQLELAVPAETTIVARENTDSVVHLVTTAKPTALPSGALSDIRDFAEVYRDPRLVSLNWLGRDAVATGRMVADPQGELAKIGVHLPKGLAVTLLVNTPTLTHLILPPQPARRYCTPSLIARLSAGQVSAALRFGRLFGNGPYDSLIAALTADGETSHGGADA